MTFTIAVAGKGGVGKSTFAALAIRHLSESTGEVVLAVDADPNSNLGLKLEVNSMTTVGALRESMTALGDEPPKGISRQEFLEYQIRLALKEGRGLDLLTMGRQEGPGCYCYVNNMLRTIVDAISEKYKYAVIDNEAGLEHLSRRTTRSSDVLFVLCDRSRTSQDSARRISALSDEMKLAVRRKVLVFNMLDIDAAAPPVKSAEGFDAVMGVRKSGFIQARMQESESLLGVPRQDPAYSDVRHAVDSERRLGQG